MSTPAPPVEPTKIERLRDSVRYMKHGGVMNTVEINELLGVLNEAEPETAPAPPAILTIGKLGPDGLVHSYQWDPVTGDYTIDLGIAVVTPAAPPAPPAP